jgi:hypothetical protein
MKTLILSLLLLFSCQKELNDAHIKYLGSWGSNDYSLEIWKDGRGLIERKNQETIECNVRIEDNKIKFRQGIHKTFDINSDPSTDNSGITTMILDHEIFYKH